jgi:ribokinase
MGEDEGVGGGGTRVEEGGGEGTSGRRMNRQVPQIVVVGSHAPGYFLRVSRLPLPGETVIGWDFQVPKDGGKGSNQAIAAARLGVRVSFVGCVGSDRIGEDGERWMIEEGVDTSHLRRSRTTASGVGFILLDAGGVPAMVTSMGANAELTRDEIRVALDDAVGAAVLLTQFEIQPQIALYAAREARERGMLAIVNPAPAPETPLVGLEAADILVPNEQEARVLLATNSREPMEPEEMAIRLREASGAKVVLMTLGERGVAGAEASGSWHLLARRVGANDTSGAGDVFCAALAVGLVRGQSLQQAADWACSAATLSVTRPGTIPAFPTAQEVQDFIDCKSS